MSKFNYYNKNTDNKGNHEVHAEDCSYIPNSTNRILIGYENNCQSAIQRVKKDSNKLNYDGCYFCCRDCHTG